MSSEVELRGTFEGDAGAIVDVTFEAKGGSPVERTVRREATLVLASGERVAIDATRARLSGFEAERRSTTWEELESTELGSLFADAAPGPHVGVKLASRGVPPGAQIVVKGTAEREAAGYRRENATPSRIVARSIEPAGFAERARKTKASKAARAKSVEDSINDVAELPWRFLVLQLVALGLVGSGVWFSRLWSAAPKHADIDIGARAMMVALATGAVIALVHGAWTRSDAASAGYRSRLLRFGRHEAKARSNPILVLLAVLVGGIVAFTGGMYFFNATNQLGRTQDLSLRDRTKSGKPGTLLTSNVRIGAGLALASVVVIAGATWNERRRSARLGRVLLRSAGTPRAGAWAVVDGVARGDAAEALLRCEVTRRAYGKGDRRNGTSMTLHATPFDLETASGTFGVRAAQCDFASTYALEHGPGRERTKRWSLPDGAQVRLAGRVREEGGEKAFVATGPESLVVFGTAEGKSVGGALAVHQALHFAANLAGLVAIAAFVYVAFL